jgi:hypothetical protein
MLRSDGGPRLDNHRMWLPSEEFLVWLSEIRDGHVDALRLQTWANDDGAVFAATLHSSQDIDLHIGMNWKRSHPTVVVRRGEQHVGSWVLSGRLAGTVDRQKTALQEIVQAVIAGSGLLRVGRIGNPSIVLRGVNSGWAQSASEIGVRIEGVDRGTAVSLPPWF